MLVALALAIFAFISVLIWPIALLLLAAVAHSAFLAGEACVERYQRRDRASALKTGIDVEAIRTQECLRAPAISGCA